jgi:protein associated with RNAse G/E
VLSYVDLDIDVLVQPDLSYQVIDLDEFAENAAKHRYPPSIVETAHHSLAQLILLIESHSFPFDFKN